MGTIVYSGRFEGRTVAIKRLVKPFFGVDHADKEIALLIATDQHPNVLRYYAKVRASRGMLALVCKHRVAVACGI